MTRVVSPPAKQCREDYLRVIYSIESGMNGDGLIKTSRIARILRVKPSSTSEMMRKLSKNGDITWIKRKGIRLTKKGRQLARDIQESNMLLKIFFKECLELNNMDLVNKLASILEHELVKEPKLRNAIESQILQKEKERR